MTSTVRNAGETLEFGPFQLQPDDRLFRNGVPLPLAPKEAAVLRTLADAGGRLVNKRTLIERAWLGTRVSDTSLTTCIYLLRRHLADARGGRDIVESVYGRGYRLTVPVRRVAADRTLLVWPNSSATSARAPDALMGHLTAAVIAAFGRSRTHGVSALGMASAERLERASDSPVAAARDAGAQFVLVVSPSRRTAAELTVTAELRRADDDGVLLAQTFTGHPQALAALADRLAGAAIQRLPVRDMPPVHGRLRRAAQTEPRVYEAYLEARHWLRRRTPEGARRAIEYFEKALEWDPAYAPAYIGLADSWGALRAFGAADGAGALARVRECLAQAEALDPAVPGAGILRAAVASFFDWQFDDAEVRFRLELDRDPTDVITLNYYVRHLVASGRPRDAVPVAENLVALDPLSPAAHALAAYAFHYARLPERSRTAARHAVELDAGNCLCLTQLAVACSQLGEYTPAVDAARRAYERSGRLGSVGLMYASVCARAGEQSEAHRLIRLARDGEPGAPPSLFGLAYAALGEEHETRIRLAAALRERCLWLPMMLNDPRLDRYAERPWFRLLSERVAAAAQARGAQVGGGAPGALLQA